MAKTQVDQNAEAGWLQTRVSRAHLLAAAGVGLALAAMPGSVAEAASPGTLSFPFFPAVNGTYTPESILDILNMLVTFEHWRMTTTTAVLQNLDQSSFDSMALSFVQAVGATSIYHADFLESLGGHSLETQFTFLPRLVQHNTYLLQEEFAGALFTATYLTAAREFAELGQPTLVKYAYQAGATYAEQRGLARALATMAGLLSESPANNKAFETDHFVYVRDAYKLATAAGVFGGVFPAAYAHPFPGRDVAIAAVGPVATVMLQMTPNNASVSTTDQSKIEGERGSTP